MKHLFNRDAARALDGEGSRSPAYNHGDSVVAKGHGHVPASAFVVPNPDLIFHGNFKREGVDLVLSREGEEFVLRDYFKGEARSAIASPDGAHLTADIVKALAGHVDYAQAAPGVAMAQVIGHVTKLTGSATAIRNGVSVILNNGDNVEKGDVVSTGSDSTLGITFIDGTVFGLSSNARMMLNEMVYDPNGSSNSSLLSLIAGTITFVAGETAKHGDMKVDTPVATMGIRGTAVVSTIRFIIPAATPTNPNPEPQPQADFQVLVEPNGTTGSYILFDKLTLLPIATVNQAGQMIQISGGSVTLTNAQLSPEVQKLIDDVFTLKFTDNSGNTKLTTNFTDSIIPESIGPLVKTASVTVPTFSFTVASEKSAVDNQPANIFFLPGPAKISVTPVNDKTHFSIAEQVQIADSNPSDVLTPYVSGSATILSITGPNLPEGIDLVKLVSLDVTTGVVSYDPAKFKFLGANKQIVITIGFDSRAGPDLFHETLDVTITGTNEGASISGTATGAVKEDGTLTAGGTLVVSDVDSGENHFQTPASLSGTYGTFTFDPFTGVWTYTLNNAAANVQALVGGQIVHDKLTVTSADGTASQLIDVTITGTNDNNSAPVVASSGTTFDTIKNLAANNGQVVCSDGHFFFGDTNLPVSDADNNPVGIMITAVDNANGDWEYKLAGTSVWLKIPTTGDLLLSPNDSVRFIGAANAPIEQLTFKAWDGTDGHVAGEVLLPPPTAFGGSTAYSVGTYVVGAKNNAPAGIAGDPINLGLVDTSSDMTYKATVTIKDIPNDWVINERERNADGSWTVQTTALDSISVTTPSSFSGALLLDVTASLVFADGATATLHLGDNIEAYSPSSPIFAWAGNDYLTASNGSDLIVFAQPIGHDIVYSFDASHDQIDLIGYAGFTSFSDIESHLTDDGKGDAVLTLSDGQSILLQGTRADTLTEANFVFDQTPVVHSNGTLTIYDGALLPLTGYVHNSGTIMLSAIGAETDLQLTENGATLDGGGSIVLSDSDLNIISGTSSNVTLDNKDNTISGAGQLGNGELRLTNAGTIDATGWRPLVIDTGSNLVQNSGVLEASGKGGLTIISSVENSGVLWAHGAKLTVQGTITGNGNAAVDGGGILDLESSSTANVSFGSETGGTLDLGDAFHFNGVISGFKTSDVIELENINPNGATISYLENSEGTGGMLTIANGAQIAHLSFSGDYSADNFVVVSDQVNATSIIYMPRGDLV